MAIGWMAALKIIPWGQVLESAPHLVKAARHLFSETRKDAGAFAESAAEPPASSADERVGRLERRIRLLESRIAELRSEQESSTELIKSLAEQNALIVDAIGILRLRAKLLLAICLMLMGVLAGGIVWLAAGG